MSFSYANLLPDEAMQICTKVGSSTLSREYCLAGGTGPVSYTHLDVYKRQARRHTLKSLFS